MKANVLRRTILAWNVTLRIHGTSGLKTFEVFRMELKGLMKDQNDIIEILLINIHILYVID